MELKTSEVLSSLLKSKRLSLSNLAKNTGIPKSTLFNWSQGVSPSNHLYLKTLAIYFDVQVHFILYGTNEEEQQGVSNGPN